MPVDEHIDQHERCAAQICTQLRFSSSREPAICLMTDQSSAYLLVLNVLLVTDRVVAELQHRRGCAVDLAALAALAALSQGRRLLQSFQASFPIRGFFHL